MFRTFWFSLILLLSAVASADFQQKITLATTTSTENSGLLDYLIPKFEEAYNIKVKTISAGTGRALKLAENGDVDLVMVHAPSKEIEFLKRGFGIDRRSLMHNNFIIIGPKNDPADVKNAKNVVSAFSKIWQKKTNFISRADNSGTYFKEIQIWKNANITPKDRWYKEIGQGMGKATQIADELFAYTLVDEGTWLKFGKKLNLQAFYFAEKLMFNPYSVILVSPIKHPNTKHILAKIFANWLTLKSTKKLINQYKIDGKQLFFAN